MPPRTHPNQPAPPGPGLCWVKSSFSLANGDCTEVAALPGGIGVRDSKDPAGPVLRFTPGQWQAFLSCVRNGESGSRATGHPATRTLRRPANGGHLPCALCSAPPGEDFPAPGPLADHRPARLN